MGGDGDDYMWGDGDAFDDVGSDWMEGGNGHDYMYGGQWDDVMFGDAGNDTLMGD